MGEPRQNDGVDVVQFYQHHWYSIGAVIAIGVLAILLYSWGNLSTLRWVLLLNFVVLLCHQFEEYRWPGGFPAIMNQVLQPSTSGVSPDRYPLNQRTALLVNVPFAYTVYLLPVLFPHVIWLGVGTVLFGFGQLIIHGVQVNREMGTVYNPGLAAVVFGFLPVGSYYIYYVQVTGLATVLDWVLGLGYLVVLVGVIFGTIRGFADENSPYPFSDAEL